MFLTIVEFLRNIFCFTASYSNNVFPDPLTKEEEDLYLEKVKLGDKEARSKLIEHNLRLVAHIVKKFEHRTVDQDDLISIGTIGLIKGIDSYKKSKAVRVTTYVAKCIENEILMFFRSQKNRGITVSLNDSIGYDKDGNEVNLIDMLKDDSIDVLEEIHIKENISLLKEYFKVLSPREQEILIKRYGLLNEEEHTQKEIAKKLHISRSYVSRIEKRALTKVLKEFIKNNKGL